MSLRAKYLAVIAIVSLSAGQSLAVNDRYDLSDYIAHVPQVGDDALYEIISLEDTGHVQSRYVAGVDGDDPKKIYVATGIADSETERVGGEVRYVVPGKRVLI